MTPEALQNVAELLQERANELGDVLDERPSTVDAAICTAIGLDPSRSATMFARLAAVFCGLDANNATERFAARRAGFPSSPSLPPHLRANLLALCALPMIAPPPPKATAEPAPAMHVERRAPQTALERLEAAIGRELSTPYAEQRQPLLRRWRQELRDLEDNHHDTHAFA